MVTKLGLCPRSIILPGGLSSCCQSAKGKTWLVKQNALARTYIAPRVASAFMLSPLDCDFQFPARVGHDNQLSAHKSVALQPIYSFLFAPEPWYVIEMFCVPLSYRLPIKRKWKTGNSTVSYRPAFRLVTRNPEQVAHYEKWLCRSAHEKFMHHHFKFSIRSLCTCYQSRDDRLEGVARQ